MFWSLEKPKGTPINAEAKNQQFILTDEMVFKYSGWIEQKQSWVQQKQS